jgi:hypothetical protein
MAKRAVEHLFTGTTTPYTSYDSTKTNLGQWIQQKTGALGTDKYAGPFPVSMVRPMEQSTAIPGVYPHVIDVGNNIHWIFLADNATAAATRRIVCYTYNTSTQTWGWRGFITLTYPPATNHTIRGMRVVRHTYSTGTVAVSGTAVTGSSTAWQTARYAVGARIGFGSTDPNNISTWYYISAIASDTSITLSGSAGTIGSGTSFVIEELRVYTATTNATATNGGLFVAKGVNFNDFAMAGTTIAAATTTDNIKAVYWLKDASTVTNTAAGGIAMEDSVSDTAHNLYVINANTGTTLSVFKYNVRASLGSLSSGASTSAFTLVTGTQATTGTISQTNAARGATLSHGPGSGVECIYTVTTTRVIRIPLTSVIAASTTFISDSMAEIPPGSANTYAATSALTSVEYAGSIDRLVITAGGSQRHYVTTYQTGSASFDKVLFCDTKQIDQSTADSNITPVPTTQTAGFSVWMESGIGYFARNSTTATVNQVYAIPIGADWDFAVGTSSTYQNRLITPSLTTTGCQKYSRVALLTEKMTGSDNLGTPLNPTRIYYRTSGISDDSGSWTLVSDTGDLTSISGANAIQFMIEFKVISETCLPARVFGLVVTYDDDATDSHYQPSVSKSSISSKIFAWRFATAFGGTVPTLTVKLYDAVSGSLLITDTTDTEASGTFQKTTDGTSWSTYDDSDKSNETTYIRYTPSSMADNIKVRAVLLQ